MFIFILVFNSLPFQMLALSLGTWLLLEAWPSGSNRVLIMDPFKLGSISFCLLAPILYPVVPRGPLPHEQTRHRYQQQSAFVPLLIEIALNSQLVPLSLFLVKHQNLTRIQHDQHLKNNSKCKWLIIMLRVGRKISLCIKVQWHLILF